MSDQHRFGSRKNESKETEQTQKTQAQQNFTQPQQGVNMQQPQAQAIGHSQINNVLRRSGKQTQNDMRSGMALKSFLEVQKICETNQTLERGFSIIRFDRDQWQVGYASIVVIRLVDAPVGKVVFARPIMIENKALRLPARYRKINQHGLLQDQIECLTAPQDIYTNNYWERMVQCVRQHVGVRDIPVYSAGGYLLPHDVDVEDTVRIESVLLNTVNRIDDAVGRFIGEQPFSLGNFKNQNETLAVDVHHSDQVVVNSAGHPERADIMVTLKRELQHQNQQQNEFYDSDNTINQLYGYVDLEYSPDQTSMVQYGQQPIQRPPFQPVFVITGVRQAPWINASTIELFLYALSNAYRVTQGHQWARSFMPVPGKTRRERDIGAIGYLMANREKAPTNSEQFSDEHFNALMTAGVRQQLTFAIDLDVLGDNSHIDSILMNLMSPANMNHATSIVRQACTNLFGAGVFEQFFKFDKPILTSYPTAILSGYYLDKNNERRDRRDFDVLAALNATNGNQMEFMNWYRTVCDINMDADIRLKNRDSLDRQYMGSTLTTTGKLQRGLFNPDFLTALANAVQATGIGVNMTNVTNIMGGHQFAGNAMVSNFAVTQPMTFNGVANSGPGVGVASVPGMSY